MPRKNTSQTQADGVGIATLTCHRERNEDFALARGTKVGLLLALADGLGGHPRGQEASEAACLALTREMERGRNVGEPALQRAFTAVDRAVARTGGGTTLVVALVVGGDVWLAHVGDSRAYLLRSGRLVQLTRDHSVVEELYEQGRLREGEMRTHPLRHIVSRALGTGGAALREHNLRHMPSGMRRTAEPAVQHLPLRRGDVLLLCSDGVSNELPPAVMLEILEGQSDAARAADALVRAADRRGRTRGGGHDNATALVYRHGLKVPVARV